MKHHFKLLILPENLESIMKKFSESVADMYVRLNQEAFLARTQYLKAHGIDFESDPKDAIKFYETHEKELIELSMEIIFAGDFFPNQVRCITGTDINTESVKRHIYTRMQARCKTFEALA